MVRNHCPFKQQEDVIGDDNKCDLLCALWDRQTNECIIARMEIDLQQIATNTGRICETLLPE